MITVNLLESLGLEGLRDGRKEITGKCPAHLARVGRYDRHASWSINKSTGAHICFSCGWKGGLTALYLETVGEAPSDVIADLAAINFKSSLAPEYDDEVIEPWEWKPESLVPVPDRLRELRHLSAESLAVYGVLWDPELRCWVLPFTTPFGEVFGAQYRQKGNEINQPPGVEKSESLFGLHACKGFEHVALVESPLDCVRLHQVGIPAVASYGAYVSDKQVDLLNRYFNLVVIALDNDDAGFRATDSLVKRLSRKGCAHLLFDYSTLSGCKDPGDVENDQDLREAWERTTHIFHH